MTTNAINGDNPPAPAQLTVADLEATLSAWLNAPVATLATEWTAARLDEFERFLQRHIIGQRAAIAQFIADFKKAVVLGRGARDGRPLTSMLSVGPSGVGKSDMARRIAEFMFGDGTSHLLHVNCSQLAERHTLAALWGAPPGYVGYGQPSIVDQVRKQPFSVVLFDEIEKMHPSGVTNLLNGLLGDGTVRDLSYGRLVSFANTICIVTSNLGTEFANRTAQHIGYQAADPGGTDAGRGADRDETLKALEGFFRPEILGRFDSVCFFNHLAPDALNEIVDLNLADLSREQLAGARVVLSPLARQVILREGASPNFGARNLKKVVKDRVLQVITEGLLSGAIQRGPDEVFAVDVTDAGRFVVGSPPTALPV